MTKIVDEDEFDDFDSTNLDENIDDDDLDLDIDDIDIADRTVLPITVTQHIY